MAFSKERERELAEAFLATRSPEAFQELFEALYPKLVRYFFVRGTGRLAGEELAQDVLMSVYRHCDTLRDPLNFFGWLFQIAHNQLLQHLRRTRHDIETSSLDARDADVAAGAPQGRDETGAEFLTWMGLLEPQERQVMMLRYLEDLGYQEIAEALGMPLGTVKWKIHNAKEKLAHSLARPAKNI